MHYLSESGWRSGERYHSGPSWHRIHLRVDFFNDVKSDSGCTQPNRNLAPLPGQVKAYGNLNIKGLPPVHCLTRAVYSTGNLCSLTLYISHALHACSKIHRLYLNNLSQYRNIVVDVANCVLIFAMNYILMEYPDFYEDTPLF